MSMSVLSLDRSINKDSLKSIGFDISRECRYYTKFEEYSDSIYYEFEHDLKYVGPFGGKLITHFTFIYYPENYDGPVIMYAKHNNIAAQNVVFAFTNFGYLRVGVYNPNDIDDLAVWIQSHMINISKLQFK